MIKLTKKQEELYPAIMYYLQNGPRCAGKSFLLAYCYLDTANQNKGKEYYPIDFPNSHYRHVKYLLRLIEIIAKEQKISIKISKLNSSFLVRADMGV